MEIEKLTNAEMRRIEKYIETIVQDKINSLDNKYTIKEQEEEKLKKNKTLQRLCKDFDKLVKRGHALATKQNLRFNAYESGSSFVLSYDWVNPQLKINEAKIKEIRKLHKQLKEHMIFKGKPEILKAIRALEAV